MSLKELNGVKVLLLNADTTPISLITWKEAFKRIYKETSCVDCHGSKLLGDSRCARCNATGYCPSAYVLEYYDKYLSDHRGHKHFVPAVIANARQVKRAYGKMNFSRINVFRRDNFTCQYCGEKAEEGRNLELEHVVPRSKWNGAGSPTCWTNIVAACTACNRKKADYFLAHSQDAAVDSSIHVYMPLFRVINDKKVFYKRPKAPRQGEFRLTVDLTRMKHIPEEWLQYVEHLIA